MFGIGMPELALILVVALLVLGPKRLPEIARQLGKAMAEFRRQTSGVMEEFQAQLTAEEEAERQGATRAIIPKTPVAETAAAAPVLSGTPPDGTS